MVRFPTPVRRRKARQVNYKAGDQQLVPDELLVCEFGKKSGTHGYLTTGTMRVLRDGAQVCVQFEDAVSGAEGWMKISEFATLVEKLNGVVEELNK